MKTWREAVGKWTKRTLGSSSGMVSGSDASAGNKMYLVLVGFATVLTLGAYWLMERSDALYALAVIWGFFLGATFLWWMSAKMLTVMLGALFGSGASDWATANGFITATNAGVREAYIGITGKAEGFSTAPAWIFVALVLICCLPALLEKGEVTLPAR